MTYQHLLLRGCIQNPVDLPPYLATVMILQSSLHIPVLMIRFQRGFDTQRESLSEVFVTVAFLNQFLHL